jgi:hypothetical protein
MYLGKDAQSTQIGESRDTAGSDNFRLRVINPYITSSPLDNSKLWLSERGFNFCKAKTDSQNAVILFLVYLPIDVKIVYERFGGNCPSEFVMRAESSTRKIDVGKDIREYILAGRFIQTISTISIR